MKAFKQIPLPLINILGPDGLLAKSIVNYEYRPAQLHMAEMISEVMTEQKTALIEAGTGTGKTIAYLVPLITLNLRCVISTGTKNLQAQLVKKDIPLLEKIFARKIKAYSLKGRSNYICLRRWKQFLYHPGFYLPEIKNGINLIKKWLTDTKTGEKTELKWLSEDYPLWAEICSTTENCRGQKCKEYKQCFISKARQDAACADLVIVNHHLLMADCSLRQRAKVSAIPNYFRLIIDEAHMIEHIATEYFGLSLSNRRIQELIGDLRREITNARIDDGVINETLEKLHRRSYALFESIPAPYERFTIDENIITDEVKDKLYSVINSLGDVSVHLEKLVRKSDLLTNCKRRTEEIKSTLDFISSYNDPGFVFWGERQGNLVSLKVSPIDISQQLSMHLFKPLKGIILTSATLSTNQKFDYIKSRLGIDTDKELILKSHFDYKKQAIIFIPNDMPEPHMEGFQDALGPQIMRILRLTKGRALLLFTSYRNLNIVYQYLNKEKLGYSLLKQGDGPKEVLIENFCTDISSVLLATSSFWQGVDVPGEALSCVIIDKLPFSVPTDPITEARINWIKARGGEPFWEYQLPFAIITLKQGLGRLIRHRQDQGLLVILDPRICRKWYGRQILKDLPNCPIVRSFEECMSQVSQGRFF